MRLITWNINSVRLHLPIVLQLLEQAKPDVLCLQEIKTVNETFPTEALAEAGYAHQLVKGQKGYNGVAILAREPIEASDSPDWCAKGDSRHVSARLVDGTEVHNFYVPAGGDVPDREANDKFAHKLDFLAEMRDWFEANRKPDQPMVLVGDLNIAPLETDVWSHKQLLKVVSHTPIEVEALAAVQGSAAWVDAVREFVPETEQLYSWWSYRARDWSAADKGRRLDHVWVTDPLRGRLRAATVLREARGWEKPSDHAPVMVDLD